MQNTIAVTAVIGIAIFDPNALQTGAARERPIVNAGDTVGDRDTGQTGAVGERTITNAGNTVRDGNTS